MGVPPVRNRRLTILAGAAADSGAGVAVAVMSGAQQPGAVLSALALPKRRREPRPPASSPPKSVRRLLPRVEINDADKNEFMSVIYQLDR